MSEARRLRQDERMQPVTTRCIIAPIGFLFRGVLDSFRVIQFGQQRILGLLLPKGDLKQRHHLIVGEQIRGSQEFFQHRSAFAQPMGAFLS